VNAARSDPPTPRVRARACGVVAGTGVGGAQEGAGDPAAGAPGAEGRRIPAVRAAGASPQRHQRIRCRRKKRRRIATGGRPLLRGGSLRPPHREPRRRRRNKRLGRARKRPPPGGLQKSRRMPQRCRRAPRRDRRGAEAFGGATVAASAVASAPAEPSRKKKWGFSTLR
jgi:hypothetical protein